MRHDQAHYTVLRETARLEHELDLLPHNDTDVSDRCMDWDCHPEKTRPRLEDYEITNVYAHGISGAILTNEGRKQRPPEFLPDYNLIEKDVK